MGNIGLLCVKNERMSNLLAVMDTPDVLALETAN